MNKKINFVAKSAPEFHNIKDKLDKGFESIEIQLLSAPGKQEFDSVISTNTDIVSVHTPLYKSGPYLDIELNYLLYPDVKNDFLKTCEFAQNLAEFQNKNIFIVFHNSFSIDDYKLLPLITNELVSFFETVIKKFPSLIFLVENVVPTSRTDIKKNGCFIEDVYSIANMFYGYFPEKFGITLDTCHLAITELEYKLLTTNNEKCVEPNYFFRNFSFDYIFKNFGHLIKNVHLNNKIGFGSTFKTHGTPFKEGDEEIIFSFFDAYFKYNSDALICFEVREDNYLDSVNALNSLNFVKHILKDKRYIDV